MILVIAQCSTALPRYHNDAWRLAGLKILGVEILVTVQVCFRAPYPNHISSLRTWVHSDVNNHGDKYHIHGYRFLHEIPISLLAMRMNIGVRILDLRKNRVPSEFNQVLFISTIPKNKKWFQSCKYLKSHNRIVEQNQVVQLDSKRTYSI